MDCPPEEHLVRMKLSVNSGIQTLKFGILGRKMVVFHSGEGGNSESFGFLEPWLIDCFI